MKKIAILLCLCLLFGGVTARADGVAEPMYDDVAALPAASDAKAAILVEYDSGEVFFEHNADTPLPMASVTKIMTLILVLEAEENGEISLAEKIRVSRTAADMTGSEAFLDYNAEYTVSDLLRTVIVVSANDSSVALAEHIGGSESDFVALMNAKAAQLGLTHTHFADCTGLADQDHYSSARDIAVMARVLLGFEHYFDYSRIWTDTLVHPSGRVTELTNTNKLVRFYSGADGVKTGYTSKAGHCLAASAQRGGMRFIAVVLGSPSSETRFETAKGLLNYGFASCARTKLYALGSEVKNDLRITGAASRTVRTVLASDVFLISRKGTSPEPKVSVEWRSDLRAPLEAGAVVGKLTVSLDGRVTAQSDVVLAESVPAAAYGDAIRRAARGWLGRA
ncbi:MAG: D-alanyl-D-alanine carboxypeptidase [Eubacteriales bacterium]|nr:D-alanyl-D-alanine carboxypeptidase [Eubacteriales bacterium]